VFFSAGPCWHIFMFAGVTGGDLHGFDSAYHLAEFFRFGVRIFIFCYRIVLIIVSNYSCAFSISFLRSNRSLFAEYLKCLPSIEVIVAFYFFLLKSIQKHTTQQNYTEDHTWITISSCVISKK
jgi:hypothetical protein